jgi:predicted nuclease of predicted toxin-antitoxin system
VRVLFDHNLPHKLRTSLGTLSMHEIVTASYMGWRDLKNGELLRIAEESGIEVLVTGDQSLLYEQNLTGRRLAIVALSANNWPIVKNYLAEILAAIDSAAPGSFQTVDCGAFSRRKAPDE